MAATGRWDVSIADPASTDARWCRERYFAELDRRFTAGFDPETSLLDDDDELRSPWGAFLVVREDGRPVACGGLWFHGPHVVDVKRMWVDPERRGAGLGRHLLEALEREAASRGARTARLETNAALTEAIALYRSAGYAEVDPFNEEPAADLWFEKRLAPPVAGPADGDG